MVSAVSVAPDRNRAMSAMMTRSCPPKPMAFVPNGEIVTGGPIIRRRPAWHLCNIDHVIDHVNFFGRRREGCFENKRHGTRLFTLNIGEKIKTVAKQKQ
jgi:hypothetical protein